MGYILITLFDTVHQTGIKLHESEKIMDKKTLIYL